MFRVMGGRKKKSTLSTKVKWEEANCRQWVQTKFYIQKYQLKAIVESKDGFRAFFFLRVPWTAKKSNQSIPKESTLTIFIGRADATAEALIFWLPDAKTRLIGKDPEAKKD